MGVVRSVRIYNIHSLGGDIKRTGLNPVIPLEPVGIQLFHYKRIGSGYSPRNGLNPVIPLEPVRIWFFLRTRLNSVNPSESDYSLRTGGNPVIHLERFKSVIPFESIYSI